MPLTRSTALTSTAPPPPSSSSESASAPPPLAAPSKRSSSNTNSSKPKPKRARPSSSQPPTTDPQAKAQATLPPSSRLPLRDAQVYYLPSFVSEEKARDWYQQLKEVEEWYQPKLKMYGKEITQSRKIAAYSKDPLRTLKYSGTTVSFHPYPPLIAEIQEMVERELGMGKWSAEPEGSGKEKEGFGCCMMNWYEDGNVYIGNHRDNKENLVIASLSLGAERTFILTHDEHSGGKGGKSKFKSKSKSKSKSKATATAEAEAPPIVKTSSTSSITNINSNPPPPAAVDVASDSDSEEPEPLLTRTSLLLHSGSLLVMQGPTQTKWKHEIPKEFAALKTVRREAAVSRGRGRGEEGNLNLKRRVESGRISLTFRLMSG